MSTSKDNSSNIISNVIWKFAERITAQVISLLVSVILARKLFPEDYGVIGMVTVFITIANAFVTSGFPNALIQKREADTKDFSSVFYFNIALSIGIYLILFFCAPLIARFYSMESLSGIVRVMGLRLIVAGINSVQHAYVSRHMIFRKYFWSTLFGTLLSGVVGLVMAYRGFGVWALVAQYMINTTVDTVVLFITVEWKPTLYFSLERIKPLFSFGWKIFFEGVSTTVFSQLRSLIIGKVYTSSDLGYYSKAQQFPQLIVTNISSAVSSVLFPAMSKEQDDNDRLVAILRESVRITTFIVLPMLTGLAAIAPTFVKAVLTSKWLPCVPYIYVFCFTNTLTIAMIPRHQALNAIGRSDVFMIEHLIGRTISIILLVAMYRISIMALVASGVISSVIQLLIVYYTSWRFSGYRIKDQVLDVLPVFFGCLIIFVPVHLMNGLSLNQWVLLALQIIAGCVIYLLFSLITKSRDLARMYQYARTILSRGGGK